MAEILAGQSEVFLIDLPAGNRDCRFAIVVIAASTLIFLALAPFAKLPLAPLPTFIPIYQSALVINDLITVVFLLGQSQFSHPNALGMLAGGYLFTALMSTLHMLTFPGLFAPAGLLGAGPQTTAWLYMFWHGGFPLFVLGYASHGAKDRPSRRVAAATWRRMGWVVTAAGGSTVLATLGQRLLPPIMHGNLHTPALIIVVSVVWTLNLAAVFALSCRRPYSVLDLWLIVAMSAWLFDIALSAVFNSGRYDLGFYAGRIYGLLAASFVLVVLLVENGKLYIQLLRLRDSDRDKTAELHRLSTTDPLSGIANRRAFDLALDQEWRRTLRHHMALSLLMIDVDCFKRFNDTYGHVAGDQCLRAVANAVSAKARRAGELAARYGGEEFAVLLPHTDVAEATRLGALICAAVRKQKIPHSGSTVGPYVTVSIGVASVADVPQFAAAMSREKAAVATSSPAATVLVETADQALYQAKMAGRDRVVAAGADEGAASPRIADRVAPGAPPATGSASSPVLEYGAPDLFKT